MKKIEVKQNNITVHISETTHELTHAEAKTLRNQLDNILRDRIEKEYIPFYLSPPWNDKSDIRPDFPIYSPVKIWCSSGE